MRCAPSGPETPPLRIGFTPTHPEGDGSDAEKLEAFRKTMHAMKRRLELLIGLPKDKLEKGVLQGTARDLAKS
ncbi:protein-tyrosine phosphatase [Alicycliphilus sp. B1]|nr:protein-tyrosine phosphatase [Alicycliphilus sp. B1]